MPLASGSYRGLRVWENIHEALLNQTEAVWMNILYIMINGAQILVRAGHFHNQNLPRDILNVGICCYNIALNGHSTVEQLLCITLGKTKVVFTFLNCVQ